MQRFVLLAKPLHFQTENFVIDSLVRYLLSSHFLWSYSNDGSLFLVLELTLEHPHVDAICYSHFCIKPGAHQY